jgi:HEAT repeat protein
VRIPTPLGKNNMMTTANLSELFAKLRAGSQDVRRWVVEQLIDHPKSYRDWIPTLIEATGDLDETVREWAADSLETMGAPRSFDLPEIVELLSEAYDGEVAYWAATMLGRLGPSAHPATDVLARTIRFSKYLPVRERAAWALGQIGPRAAGATLILRETSENATPRLRRIATEALESIRGMAA